MPRYAGPVASSPFINGGRVGCRGSRSEEADEVHGTRPVRRLHARSGRSGKAWSLGSLGPGAVPENWRSHSETLWRHTLDRVPTPETQHRGSEGKRSGGPGDAPAGSGICFPEGSAAMNNLELDYFAINVQFVLHSLLRFVFYAQLYLCRFVGSSRF